MQVSTLLAAALFFASTVVSSIVQTELHYQPVASTAKPVELARIRYDPATLRSEVVSYSPPKDADVGLSRIGAYSESSTWVGVLSSLSIFKSNAGDKPTILLYLDSKDRLYHIGLSSKLKNKSPSSPPGINVEIVRPTPAAVPHLNKPMVRRTDEEGEEQEEVPLMNQLLQKYWWLLPIVLLLAVGGGGS